MEEEEHLEGKMYCPLPLTGGVRRGKGGGGIEGEGIGGGGEGARGGGGGGGASGDCKGKSKLPSSTQWRSVEGKRRRSNNRRSSRFVQSPTCHRGSCTLPPSLR